MVGLFWGYAGGWYARGQDSRADTDALVRMIGAALKEARALDADIAAQLAAGPAEPAQAAYVDLQTRLGAAREGFVEALAANDTAGIRTGAETIRDLRSEYIRLLFGRTDPP
jgi:hypothetical protein